MLCLKLDKLDSSVYSGRAVVYLHLEIAQHRLYPSDAVHIKVHIIACGSSSVLVKKMNVFRSLPLQTFRISKLSTFLKLCFIYSSGIKAKWVNQRGDFVHRVQERVSLYYIQNPGKEQPACVLLNSLSPDRVKAGKQSAGNTPQRVLAPGLRLAAWGGSGGLSPSIAGVAVTPQTSTLCSSAWERLRVLLKKCVRT